MKFTAIIITKNEETNIKRCLDSLGWADEVIIADSHSTDRTVEVAKRYSNVKLIDTDWLGYSPTKRLAVNASSNDWVLWIDADEEVTFELQYQILKLSEKDFESNDAFEVPRKTYFLGDWVKQWYPGWVARLFNRKVCDFNDNILHEGLIVPDGSRLSRLKGDMNHYSYNSLNQYFQKMNFYGQYGGLELKKKGKSIGKWRLVISPMFTFFKFYVLEAGFRDRKLGLIVSIGSAFSNYVKYLNYYLLVKKEKDEKKRMSYQGKRIIISRTDNIGDVILTLPMAGVLKKSIPGCTVIFLGKKYTEAIIRSSIHVDEFVPLEDFEVKPVEAFKRLRADVIIHTFPDRKVAQYAAKARIPTRVGTSHRTYNLLFCNKLVNLGRKKSQLHEAQLNLKLLTPLAIKEEFSIHEIKDYYGFKNVKPLDPQLADLIDNKKFNLIIHPKSKGSAREWKMEKYRDLVLGLPQERFQVFITGTGAEGEAMQKAGLDLSSLPHVSNLSGKLTLEQLVAFIKASDGLLACSTGPLHIASALGKYALGLYPPMRPIHPGRWAPLGEHATFLTHYKDCQDCINSFDCACLKSISVEQVNRVIMEWKEKKTDAKA